MFRGLRLRLTLLYTLAALALVAMVGGGAYVIVERYFRSITDLALQHKMAHEFHALAAPIPPALTSADRDWSLVRDELSFGPRQVPLTQISQEEAIARAVKVLGGDTPTRVELKQEDGRVVYEIGFASEAQVQVDRDSGTIIEVKREDDDDEGDTDDEERLASSVAPFSTMEAGAPLAYDAELAAIFVLPLSEDGMLLFNPNPVNAPIDPNQEALKAALANGSDVRTVTLADGRNVRLLTYRLTRSDGPAALQLGRVLSDQEQVLSQLTLGMLMLGSLTLALVGVASWWLAGRSLQPAQLAWERQQRFIASASHELRTPLTLIRASTEVALRGVPAGDVDQRELLGDVLTESDHMRRLVDDLLTLSRLDSGQLPLNPTTVDLLALLAELQRQVARLGEQRGVHVAVKAAVGSLQADADRLRQVLLILLDNALRHTPAGGQINLEATPQGRMVHLSVSDTGCGIDAEHLPHIFERFYRADPARGREGGNAGLGLAIARGLVTAMGGQIGVRSEPGQGTTIWLLLPKE